VEPICVQIFDVFVEFVFSADFTVLLHLIVAIHVLQILDTLYDLIIEGDGEGGRVDDVPVKNIKFVHGHGVNGPIERDHREEVAGGVEEDAAVREKRAVMDDDRGLSDLLGPVMWIVGHQLCKCLQSMQYTVLANEKERASEKE